MKRSLKVANEVAERRHSGWLFQRERVYRSLGANGVITLFDISEQGGGDAASKE